MKGQCDWNKMTPSQSHMPQTTRHTGLVGPSSTPNPAFPSQVSFSPTVEWGLVYPMMSRNFRSVLAWLCVKPATTSLAPKAQQWADGLMVPGGRVILTDVSPTPQVSDSSKCCPQAPTLPLRPRRINVRVRLPGTAEPWAQWGQIP